MCNKEIRDYAKEKSVPLWKIAMELGVNDGNFSRKLRVELSREKKEEIKHIIDKLATKQKGEL